MNMLLLPLNYFKRRRIKLLVNGMVLVIKLGELSSSQAIREKVTYPETHK